MKRKLLFPVLIILLSASALPANLTIPRIALENISFNLKLHELPDTLTTVNLRFVSEKKTKEFQLIAKAGEIDTSVILADTGSFDVRVIEIPSLKGSVRVIPGLLSILPPIFAIVLALFLRQVLISLLLGIYMGAIFIYDYNPIIGILRVVDTYIINTLTETSHIQVIVFTFLFGGVVGLISKSGGTRGIANIVIRYARTRRSGLIATWLAGLMIFFDDYANTLIVGNLMRPITDKLKISREKLAFIVDATSAPVASIVIVSSWIGFEIGLIQDGLKLIGSDANVYDVFMQTIPFRFYPIAMLLFVLMLAYFNRDFGPMLKAERRALKEGRIVREGASVAKDLTETSDLFGNDEKAKWYNGVVPIAVLVGGTLFGLYYTGITTLAAEGITNYGFRDIIGKSNSYLALLWSSFTACVVAGIMIVAQKIMTLNETVDAWFVGVRSMLFAILILTLAWSIGSVTQDIKTADYIISIISDTIDPRFLPVLIFFVCALTSFATGTSWGTMAIMMPIVIPLGFHVSGLYDFTAVHTELILYGVISSVLAGSVFGDHCSPIADTTILSSMASGCDHMDHVRTQLPYAIIVGLVCMVVGDIPTAFGFSPYFSLLIIFSLLAGIILLFGSKVSESKV